MRRKTLKSILHFNERTDKFAAVITFIYLIFTLADRYWSPDYEFGEPLHVVLLLVECTVALALMTYGIVRIVLIRNPNRVWASVLTDDECKSLLTWFSSGKDDPLLDDSLCRVRFASLKDLSLLADLNFSAFKNSAYEADRAQFHRRNEAFIRRNDKCFLLMIDPITSKEIIGYSCLLPLNDLGKQLYLEGSVSDATMNAELIAAAGEPFKNLLLFAIHLRDDFSFTKHGASRKYSVYFWSCIRLHLRAMYRVVIKTDTAIDLYVQTQEPSLERRLKKFGFSTTGSISKDGYPIFRMSMPVPPASLAKR
jgi:hypothetical protein